MKKISILMIVIFFVSLFSANCYIESVAETTVTEMASKEELAAISFTNGNENNNLSSVGGVATDYGMKIEPYTVATDPNTGGTIYTKDSSKGDITFQIPNSPDGYNDYYVEVEYYEYIKGFFFLEYESKTGGTKETVKSELVCSNNIDDATEDSFTGLPPSGRAPLTYTFTLRNVNFADSETAFKINTIRNDNRADKYEFSHYPVFIKGVKVYKADTSLGSEVSVKTDNTGNIFYDREIPEFDIAFNESMDEVQNIEAIVTIYKYEGDMNSSELSPIFVEESRHNIELIPNGEKVVTINPYIEDYGLYLLDVDIVKNGILFDATETEFSKCVKNDSESINKSYGANVHALQWSNTPGYMQLMKNAGLGIVRDGISWDAYEKTDDVFLLPGEIKELLKISEKYGIDPIMIVGSWNVYKEKNIEGSGNRGGLADPSLLEEYEKYITALMQDDSFSSVKMIEIENEPQRAVYKDSSGNYTKWPTDSDTTSQTYKDYFNHKGQYYAQLAKGAASAIETSGVTDKRIGILSMADISESGTGDGAMADNFMRGALSNLNKSDFDALTYHPYAYYYTPETTNSRVMKNSYSVAEANGFVGVENWYTEIGWSTAKYPENAACIGSEYKQAMWNARQYASMRAYKNNDKFVIYSLVDDDIVINEQEANYGLLHSEIYKTPYAAKYSYLTTANLNKMTGDATNISEVHNSVVSETKTETTGSVITKFASENKEVYMMWTTNTGTTDTDIVAFNEIEGFNVDNVVAYYDAVGNMMNEAEIEGIKTSDGYILSNAPIYAVCNAVINRTELGHEPQNFNFIIENNTADGLAEKKVSLFVSSVDGSYGDIAFVNNLVYADQNTTLGGGYYRFKCEMQTESDTLYASIVDESGNVDDFDLYRNEYMPRLILMENMQQVGNEGVLDKLSNYTLIVDLKDYPSNKGFVYITAYYNGDILVDSNIDEMKNTGTGSIMKLNLSEISPAMKEYDRIKLYAWDSTLKLVPICEYADIK